MDYSIEKMVGFKVIGYERTYTFENGHAEIPKFWSEVYRHTIVPMMQKSKTEEETEEEKAIKENCIGSLGVCIDDVGEKGKFRYLIAGEYKGSNVPEGMTLYEFPSMDWAKFQCIGPMPGSLQTVNDRIFKEWLPENKEYTIAMSANIEWYSPKGNTTDPDYQSAIWIPVKHL